MSDDETVNDDPFGIGSPQRQASWRVPVVSENSALVRERVGPG
ncbi:hypothetical protein [Microbacterium sp.]|nr:hypothetical protein [Microbacterium sp.]